MKTIEKNKLIADFMGCKDKNTALQTIAERLKDDEIWLPFHNVESINNLKYHKDWNWLIEVIENIESLGYRIEIVKHICRIYLSNKETIIISENIPKIEAVYNACVEFIKWYNNQNKVS